MHKNILVCLDGESHTQGAIVRSIALAKESGSRVIGLHVKDQYLKKFVNELYSQGRKEYLEYIDECLEQQASTVEQEFRTNYEGENVAVQFKTRSGEPAEEILNEIDEGNYTLAVLGTKQLKGFALFKSRNIPKTIQQEAPVETVVVY